MPVMQRMPVPRRTLKQARGSLPAHPCQRGPRYSPHGKHTLVIKAMGKDRTLCPCSHDTSTYYLGNETWEVGPRYRLKKYLGSGSFSSVCSAEDTETGQLVALKKISNVNSNLENARIVLREVCILRRLCHPHIIELHDAFWKPSPTGKMKLVNGSLVRSGIDVYLVMEHCGGGDLHELRGQLTASQIRGLMHQLLKAVQYMHGLNVWHRDLKSANVLLTVHEGRHIAKVADLGSARSGAGRDPHARRTLDDLVSTPSGVTMKATSLDPKLAAAAQTMTTRVCTPCYRAPEVVLSRGRYSSAMDMWSLGCIFGELLQRMERAGASFTPNLAIMPVFQFSTWSPNTPALGVSLRDTDDAVAGRELRAIFDVIGTPEWACIEAVESERWRSFLRRLPAQAPHLMRRFGVSGEPAVDMLRRLLAFDPKRRCCAEEALSHEYFAGVCDDSDADEEDTRQAAADADAAPTAPADVEMHTPFESGAAPPAAAPPKTAAVSPVLISATQRTRSWGVSPPTAANGRHKNAPGARSRQFSSCEMGLRLAETAGALAGTGTVWPAAGAGATPPIKRSRPPSAEASGSEAMEEDDQGQTSGRRHSAQHYYDIVEPAAALEALEGELGRLIAANGGVSDGQQGDTIACHAVCTLIKQECDAEAERQRMLREQRPPQTPSSPGEQTAFQRRWWGRRQPLEPDPRNMSAAVARSSPPSPPQVERLRRLSLEGSDGSGLLRVSGSPRFLVPQSHEDSATMGPEEQLRPGRHDEWSLASGHDLTAPEGPVWGGGLGGMDVDQKTQEVITRQQLR
eukprot:jgi/Ulvmu1/8579/UM045_0021.1